MRKRIAAILLTLASAAAVAAQSDAEAVRRELDAGARASRAGRAEEAERRFRRALELDPAGKGTRLFVARTLRQAFRAGEMTPENVAAGERAAAAYREVLRLDPADDAAFDAVVAIYKQMKRAEKVDEWLLGRANDTSVPAAKRADAFAALAAERWRCSFRITQQPASKKAAETPGGGPTVYTMPADEGDFIRARRCVTDGFGFTKQALLLDPKSLNALDFEARLLREATKLAEMEGDLGREADFVRRQQEAQEAFETRRQEVKEAEAAERAARRAASSGEEEEDDDDAAAAPDEDDAAPAATPAAAAGPAGAPADGGPAGRDAQKPKGVVVAGGILNGKAVEGPTPAYPPDAKAAGAQGVVTVRILVDEEGRVVEAEAVGGHELLRQAAVTAARHTRFPPTRLSGRPVRVSGVVTYKFELNPATR